MVKGNKLLYLLFSIFCLFTYPLKAVVVTKTTCEMAVDPLCVATRFPRFGWQISDNIQGCMQSAYAIEVFTVQSGKRSLVWESGKVLSSQSQLVSYAGKPLTSSVNYLWRVRIWDEQANVSPWSKESEFRLAPDTSFFAHTEWIGAISREKAKIPSGRIYQGGVLRQKEVKASWAAADSLSRRSIYLRRSFNVSSQLTDAVVYVSGLGHYELRLNGRKVGNSEFAPLWSDYDKTVYYNVYEVTSQLLRGENALGVLLGNGFYNEQGGRYRKLQVSFGPPTLLLKLVLTYADGRTEEVVSNADWRYALSPITFNSIYGGEDYDARLEQSGWDAPSFNDSAWRSVVVQKSPKGKLRPQQATPVCIAERYKVQHVHKLSPQEIASATVSTKRTVDPSAFVLDMGQNLSGFPEITIRGKKGQKVILTVAEGLTPEGAANQRQTGRPHYYQYTLKGEGDETWHPRFSYYGFRYIQVEGAVLKGWKNPDQLPVLKNIESCFVRNSAASVSSFQTSNTLFNGIHRIIRKAIESNMQGVFTDCPHREKLGWLEELHLNGPGLFYNYNLTQLMPKVVQDMADAQYPDGMVPTVAPQYTVFEGPGMEAFSNSPEWGSSLVIVPFMYYEAYGDSSLIVDYYRNMRSYVDYLSFRAENHILSFGLGDWYDYGDFKAGFSRNTPVPLVATAHYYMDLCYLSRAAEMVGNQYDVAYYTRMAGQVKDAFNLRFFNRATGQYGSGSQCSNALPLFLNLVASEDKDRVLNHLVEDIKAHGNRLTTGDVGTRYLFQTLAGNGLNDLMYLMQNHEDVPGYGFQLKFGATTLTEQWDPRRGASWNHFMMGQIEEWFFNSLVGLKADPLHPGFRHFIVSPQVVGELKFVKASYETLYGVIDVDWRLKGKKFILKVNVPANCTAKIYLPGMEDGKFVRAGHHEFVQEMGWIK